MASNISSIHGVHVCNGAFSDGCDIDLFVDDTPARRTSIVFGHNGSGKSTIAREIDAIRAGGGNGYFYDSANQELDLDDADRKRIRVFSEEYIESKTRIDDDGLEAFAMLGEQVEAADEIKKIDDQIDSIRTENEKLAKIIDGFKKGKNSPEALEKEAKNAAIEGGWKSRAEEVDGKAPNLTPNRWGEICKSASGQARESLEKQFNDKLVEYKKASGAGDSHLPELSLIDVERYNEARILELLAKCVENPTLSDREKRILELVQSGDQLLVEKSAKVFSNSETDACPMCLREISTQEKTSIVDSVQKVLSKEVDKFKVELRQASLQDITQQNVAEQVSASLSTDLPRAEQMVISLVRNYNDLLAERESNVYSPKTIEPLGLSEALNDLNEVIKRINEEVASINNAIDEKAKIHDALLDLNNKIAAADALSKIKESEKASQDLAEALGSQSKNNDNLQALGQSKAAWEARMRKVDIAVDVINAYLANVYFDTKKFQLQSNGDKYKIISNDHTVKPMDISTGERNILALCYFFSESGKNREKNHEDDDPQYLVLDDPISSFDMENRIGVCSLIRERSEHLLRSNAESRITVMTHDGGVVEELENIFSDISDTFDGEKIKTDLFELRGKSSEPRGKKSSEYVALLKRAYKFASAEDFDPNESYVIGNILRRVLEGYSTFNYGIGMSRLSSDPDLRERLGDQLPFLKDAMYRLALNDASHMEKRIKAFNPTNAFERYSNEEKKKCAQCVMVILDKLDPVHLKKHLGSCQISQQEIENHLREWSNRFTPAAL
ncbi:AAA family ATPase [Mobiluncus curtisii]|uniref:AAA family ATPase n=1 Tax=Mobiluncus curtisii TaxID=2051 RepID=A0A7Y0UG47_9ACTO|nr:AAA family ATPase [Mobiluncus curtisii]MCU9986970.1 AAA family ATPase [Mobiluncus curtisii]MCU9999870.1 AAA family ATPase [Mobiluncus curtisii]MCV0021667.1 AAA family ATPase [Mobiluncus curtisii]NMW49149.1 AAA family ATPase [Mobiluncus curtisii]NMW86704.1 AAA family ATPase [Mobiluncus curtisii]